MDFTFKHTSIRGKEARYLQLNNEGVEAVFYSANVDFLKPYLQLLYK